MLVILALLLLLGDVVEGPQMDRLSGITTQSDYNIVENNYVKGHSVGIILGRIAQYNIVRNNTVLDPKWSAIVIGSSYGQMQGNLIENNILCGGVGEDGIQFSRRFDIEFDEDNNRGVIVRNNIICNNGENAIDLKAAAHIVIEGNIIYGNIGSNDGPFNPTGYGRTSWPGGIMKGNPTGSRDVIIRNNVLYDNLGGVSLYAGYKFYNNTLVANNRDYTGPNSNFKKPGLFNGLHSWSSSGIFIKNNIIGGHNEAEIRKPDGAWGRGINNNLYFNDGGAKFGRYIDGGRWEIVSFSVWKSLLDSKVSGADSNSLEADPLFRNVPDDPAGPHEKFDFRLKPGSPAIDSGTFLTKTLNSGSGTQINVEDAGYFMDGFGITDGDLIQVGSNSNCSRRWVNERACRRNRIGIWEAACSGISPIAGR